MKQFSCFVLSVALMLILASVTGAPAEAAGRATEIWSIEDLYDVRYASDQSYILMADIDMEQEKDSGYMGNSGVWPTIESFSGSFDGNGHTISGLNANLFSTNSGEIRNLNLVRQTFTLLTENEGILDGLTANDAEYAPVFAETNAENALVCRCIVDGAYYDYQYAESTAPSLLNKRTFGGMITYNHGTIEACGVIRSTIHHPTLDPIITRQGGGRYLCSFYEGCICDTNSASGVIKNTYCICDNQSVIANSFYNYQYEFNNINLFVVKQKGQIENCYGNIPLFDSGFTVDAGPTNCCYVTDSRLTTRGTTTTTNCYSASGEITLPLMKRESTFAGFDFENTWIIDRTVAYPYPQLRNNRQDTAKLVKSLTFKYNPSTVSYRVGDRIVADGIISATYIDDTMEEIPITESMLSGYDLNEIGEQTVTISYRDKTLTYRITVRPPHSVAGVTLVSGPDQAEFVKGSALNYSGAVARVEYADGDIESVNLTPGNTNGGSTAETGIYNVEYAVGGFTVTFRITVVEDSGGENPPAPPFSDAPLRLVCTYNRASKTATVSVETTDTITLSNYDVTLVWDSAVFTLSDMVNGQPSVFPNFQNNKIMGKISAASNENDVTVAAGKSIASYVLTTAYVLAPDEYGFSLSLKDASDAEGNALPWKGQVLTGSLIFAVLSSDCFDCRAADRFLLDYETPAAGDFTVTAETPCIVLYHNGSAYQKLAATLVSGETYSYILPTDYSDAKKIVVAVKADFNHDGDITSTDALQVLRCAAGNRSFDETDVLICDINADRELTSTDALQILRVAVGSRMLVW